MQKTANQPGGPALVWPVPGFGRVTSGFRTADRPDHMGVDVGRNASPPAPIDGAVIVAAAAGEIAGAGRGHASMGDWLEIDHGGGWRTRYMHCRELLVDRGRAVRAGEAVALVGSTGRSTGPHLHFEVSKDGERLDPMLFFPDGGATAASESETGTDPAAAGTVSESGSRKDPPAAETVSASGTGTGPRPAPFCLASFAAKVFGMGGRRG